MTVHRVTQQSLTTSSLNGLQSALGRIQSLQVQLSSGKAISKPSDNPVGATDALRYRADIRRTEQLKRNLSDAQGWLNTADSTMSNMITVLRRARELVLQGATGTSDATGRAAMAKEVDNIKEQLLSFANTTFGNRQIFSGTASPVASGQAVYDSSATYYGNTDAIYRTIGPGGETVQINMDGPSVFGASGATVFDILQKISDDLNASSPSSVAALGSSDITNLDAAMQTLQIALSTIGARAKRVDDQSARLLDLGNNATNQLSEVEDIDLPKTITALQLQQVAYQSALAATARALQPSLLDFLR